jgi:membrane fusion protein, multidrug efflux system
MRLPIMPRGKGALAAIVVVSMVVLAACSQSPEQQARQMPPPPVTTMTVQKTEVEVIRDYPARVHGSRQVQVRARVDGILKERLYQEGRKVERDDLLFRIDPERYQIALRRSEAELTDARANLAHAEREWSRYSSLYEQTAVSELQRDQAETDLEVARARLELAEVVVDDARRNLRYTEVRAPIAGVTDLESHSEGNLIEWGGLLTTITQQDPVHVRFAMPETDAAIREPQRFAELLLPSGAPYDRKGEIDFTSSTIDPRTGTISLRAVFPNPAQTLVPGQFVRIRVMLQRIEGVHQIPSTAVSQGREGPQVFVVGAGDTAEARQVVLGPVVQGQQVVLEGLQDGDRVVINGHVALRDGMPVSVIGESGR